MCAECSETQLGAAAPSSCPLGDGAPSGTGHRLPVDRSCSWKGRDLPGYWTVRHEHAEVEHPAGPTSPHPSGGAVAAFAASKPLGFRQDLISGLHSPGLLACVPTHRRRRYLRRRKARYRPAGYALVGRDFHPLDDELNFKRYRIASLLSDQHCLVALLDQDTRQHSLRHS